MTPASPALVPCEAAAAMRTLSLFSGIGGLDLGLTWAGFEIVAHCEADPFCRQVLRIHWPDVPCFSNVRKVTAVGVAEVAGEIDVVVGGFPCQDISVAGKGGGVEAGERSGLWKEMFRIVDALRPRWIIAENVPALRTRGADRVLGDLEAIGYTCTPVVVAAEDVGAPHQRQRVFVVANASGERLEKSEEQHARSELTTAQRGCVARRNEKGQLEHAARFRRIGHPHAGQDDAAARLQEQAVVASAGGRIGPEPLHVRWPAGPEEPQHGWEEPRLVSDEDLAEAERALDGSAHGLPAELVRRARRRNRDALKGYGNAVVPHVSYVVGRAVMSLDQDLDPVPQQRRKEFV